MSATSSVVHPGTPENLPRFLHFIEDVCKRIEVNDDIKYALHLAVEEVCTNLIHYGYRGRPPGPIEVAVHEPDASKPFACILDDPLHTARRLLLQRCVVQGVPGLDEAAWTVLCRWFISSIMPSMAGRPSAPTVW